MAAHIHFSLFGRSFTQCLVTRMCFADDPDRRHRLVAEPDSDGNFRFDIRLQGDDESVFLSV